MIHRLFRLMRINLILMRYNIDEIVLGYHPFYPIRALIYLNPFYWTRNKNLSRAERVRKALEELGPIFVKAGQILSTRRDIIPDDISVELSKLQDRVPPFSGVIAKKMIEKALQKPIETIFSYFEMEPLASASIAQVHAATLQNGDTVVVKVLRPQIQQIIARDIDLLETLAKLFERYSVQGKKFKPRLLIQEIAQTLYDELDLMREGSNASQLKRNFSKDHDLYVPKIYWEYSNLSMLVMERLYGIPINDLDALKHAQVNMKKLAETAIEVFFTQVFRDSYFHADLHPGNIFVDAKNPQEPTLMVVDFGIVGSLSHEDQRYLAENMLAFFKRDYQRVAELHIACGWLPPDTRIDQFEGAIRAVSEPIFEQRLRDISFGFLLLRLFQVARRFNINIQPQLILLQKSLLNIEGLCRELAPDFDLWGQAAPMIEHWLKKQVGPRAFIKSLRENLPLWSQQLPAIPSLVYEVLIEMKHQQEKMKFKENSVEPTKKTSYMSHLLYFVSGVALTALGMFVWYRM